jgi:uncharacterized membrane protein
MAEQERVFQPRAAISGRLDLARYLLVLVPPLGFALGWLALSRLRQAGWYGFPSEGDVAIYYNYALEIAAGRVPYRDFQLVYPPGAIPAFVLPWLTSSGHFHNYVTAFTRLTLVYGMLTSLAVAFTLWRTGLGAWRLALGVAFVSVSPVLVGQLIMYRYDLWPAMLTALALAAVAASRVRTGSALLGIGAVAKVYPAVIAPLLLAYVWKRLGRREALICGAAFTAGVGVFLVPLLALTPTGVMSTLVSQLTRPLQVEALPAAALFVAHGLAGYHLHLCVSYAANCVAGTVAADLADVESLFLFAIVGSIWVGFAWGEARIDRFLRASAATVAASIALGKILSPQYLIWLVPLVPLVGGRRGILAMALLAAALALTAAYFPGGYGAMVNHFEQGVAWTVLVRDVILLALVAVLALPWPGYWADGAFRRRSSTPRDGEPA